MSTLEIHSVAVVPAWVDDLVELVRQHTRPLGFIGYLGYRAWEPQSVSNPSSGWMLAVFPTPFECRGGAVDGGKIASGFCLDVHALMASFTGVERLAWNAPVRYNGDLDGPELLIEGLFAGERVLLRVFHRPPPDEAISHVVDPNTGRVREVPV